MVTILFDAHPGLCSGIGSQQENAWRLATSLRDKEAYFSEQERALAELRDTLETQVKHVEQDLLAS